MAAAEFARVVAERPADSNARRHLGEVLMLWGDQLAAAGNFEEAATHYTGAISLRADDPELRVNLGNALLRLGRFEDARVQFSTALRLAPDSQVARKTLDMLDSRVREKPR